MVIISFYVHDSSYLSINCFEFLNRSHVIVFVKAMCMFSPHSLCHSTLSSLLLRFPKRLCFLSKKIWLFIPQIFFSFPICVFHSSLKTSCVVLNLFKTLMLLMFVRFLLGKESQLPILRIRKSQPLKFLQWYMTFS